MFEIETERARERDGVAGAVCNRGRLHAGWYLESEREREREREKREKRERERESCSTVPVRGAIEAALTLAATLVHASRRWLVLCPCGHG